jgi:F-type H+-transporting ATPase subunit gamma
MPSIKDLKKRIVSIRNTQQTTQAMKMVSAAKLRRAQDAIAHQKPYALELHELIQVLVLQWEDLDLDQKKPDFLRVKSLLGLTPLPATEKVFFLLVTSDRGLCGGFNSSVIRFAQRLLTDVDHSRARMAFLGNKGYVYFKDKVSVWDDLVHMNSKVTFSEAKRIADYLINLYLTHQVDQVKIIYNEFKNVMTQKPVVETFLPLPRIFKRRSSHQEFTHSQRYLVKPDPLTMLEALVSKSFAIQLFRILLESQAGEHGARMSAMESATRNAGEMIRELTLQYNKQRQAGITKELLEIIAGSESQKK